MKFGILYDFISMFGKTKESENITAEELLKAGLVKKERKWT